MRLALVDLDAPPAWFRSLQAGDHLTADAARAFAGTVGRVLLLTNPVSLGYAQNPISVYYCYNDEGSGISASGATSGSSRAATGGGGGGATPPGGRSPVPVETPNRRRTRLQSRLEQEAGNGAGGGGGSAPSVAAAAEGLGAPARAIAEVTNTPWGDRVRFAFDPAGDQSPKALHVSPFMDMGNTW